LLNPGPHWIFVNAIDIHLSKYREIGFEATAWPNIFVAIHHFTGCPRLLQAEVVGGEGEHDDLVVVDLLEVLEAREHRGRQPSVGRRIGDNDEFAAVLLEVHHFVAVQQRMTVVVDGVGSGDLVAGGVGAEATRNSQHQSQREGGSRCHL